MVWSCRFSCPQQHMSCSDDSTGLLRSRPLLNPLHMLMIIDPKIYFATGGVTSPHHTKRIKRGHVFGFDTLAVDLWHHASHHNHPLYRMANVSVPIFSNGAVVVTPATVSSVHAQFFILFKILRPLSTVLLFV